MNESLYAELDLEARALMSERRMTYAVALQEVGRRPARKPGQLPSSARLDLDARRLMTERGQPTAPSAPSFRSDYRSALDEVVKGYLQPARQAEANANRARQRRLDDHPAIAMRMAELAAGGIPENQAYRQACREAVA